MQIHFDYVLLFALCSDLKYGAGNVEFVLAFCSIPGLYLIGVPVSDPCGWQHSDLGYGTYFTALYELNWILARCDVADADAAVWVSLYKAI